jgi:hypothetical protein
MNTIAQPRMRLSLIADEHGTNYSILDDALPHGSGIDCGWTFNRQKNGSIVARNSFHLMDEHGFYIGYQNFFIKLFEHKNRKLHKLFDGTFQIIHDIGDIDFTLCFSGYRQTCNSVCGLREYLEDTIHHCLTEANILTKQRMET